MNGKIKSIEDLKSILGEFQKQGKKIVTTNGSFDIMHAAHVRFLRKAKSLGDVLVILLNSDGSIKTNKTDKRPIVPEKDRAELLAALDCVNYITIFSEKKPLKVIEALKPDIHAKGGTFFPERVAEEKTLVESWGGEHKLLELEEGYSTTSVIDKILDVYKEK